MSVFNRGLDDAFVAAFNKEYDKGGWLNALVDDEELFVAIRENYVSFYYRGCSLLQLGLQAGTMIGKFTTSISCAQTLTIRTLRSWMASLICRVIRRAGS